MKLIVADMKRPCSSLDELELSVSLVEASLVGVLELDDGEEGVSDADGLLNIADEVSALLSATCGVPLVEACTVVSA